jgi:hypothetical protein
MRAFHITDHPIALQRQMFAEIAQHRVHASCGSLWKTKKNFPAKTIARVHQRTYVVVRLNTNASSQMSTWGDGREGRDRSIEANGSGTNALSQMSTC